MKVLIDGNNVFRYNDGYNVSYLEAMFLALDAKRIDWFCFADANLPYLVRERCLTDEQDLFTGIINKYSGRIQCAPSGKRADNFILQKADHEGLNIVSNDRYSDYEDRYSWLRIRDRGGNYKDSRRRVYPFMFADGVLQIEDLDVYWDMKNGGLKQSGGKTKSKGTHGKKGVTIATDDYAIASIIIENLENTKFDGASDAEKQRMTEEKAIWESDDDDARQQLIDAKIAEYKAKKVAAIPKQEEDSWRIPGTFGLIAIKKEQDARKRVVEARPKDWIEWLKSM